MRGYRHRKDRRLSPADSRSAAQSRAAAPEERGYTRVLILAPTRELAVQIADDVEGFSYHTDITSVAVYGGVEMGPQERALKRASISSSPRPAG